ncbi:hypothetical protein J7E73_17845 [Paenibacillus albidus]|nr:hypothetical protein [Paenibacillus albidus]
MSRLKERCILHLIEWEGVLSLVETGAQVKAGQLLLEFDMEFIEAAGIR